jgi:hypothetical protein
MKKILITTACFLAFSIAKAQHSLVLKNGEKITGTLQGINEGTVSFLVKGTVMNVKVDDITALYFSESNGEVKKDAGALQASDMRGVKYEMAGRQLTKPPKIDNLTMEKGVVVVEITIDKGGRVIKANPGAEGTTTTSNYLLTKAKQAAQTVEFDNCPKCPLESKGIITITF